MSDLKLYSFEPSGHGSYIFVCIAETIEEAYSKLNQHILTNYTSKDGYLFYEAGGWGTDYYTCKEHELSTILNFQTS
jgi:hypothetical protein